MGKDFRVHHAPEAELVSKTSRAPRGAPAFLRRIVRKITGHGAAMAALGVRLGAAALAYLLQIVLARSLGAADYGTFSFAWSLVTIGGFLATLGFGQIAVRFLAQYHHSGDFGLARGFLRVGVGATLGGSLAIAGLAITLFPLVERGYGHLCITTLAIGVIALPFFALTDFMEGIARSQGWTIRALAPPYIIRQGMIILLLVAALAAGRQVGAEAAMAAALGATLLAAFAQILLIARPLRSILPDAPPRYDMPEWGKAAMPTLLSDFALLARQNIDLILLGLMAPAAAVGLYFAATRLASLLGLIDFAIGAAFGHRFARAKETGIQETEARPAGSRLEPLFAEARRLTFLPGIAAAAALGLATPYILMLFGPEFATAVIPTRILIAAAALRLACGPVDDMLGMAGYPEIVWRANAIGALVMAILCLLLTPDWHATGAATAAACGALASLCIGLLGVRRELGFWPFMARMTRAPS
jgi:O-antigen/teichoic acid export membrane protein